MSRVDWSLAKAKIGSFSLRSWISLHRPDQFQQVGDVDRINNLETLALEGGLQLANGFFFKENAQVVEDGNDIHRNAPHVKGRSPSGMVSEERSEDKRGN